LQLLDLGGNQIGAEGIQALAQSGLTALVTLNLWGNMIGKNGAKYISEVEWPSLTNLNLCNSFLIQTIIRLKMKELATSSQSNSLD
jgi:Ran GTPase-activating protein (RanGAP) involved in mRNA processing and transport